MPHNARPIRVRLLRRHIVLIEVTHGDHQKLTRAVGGTVPYGQATESSSSYRSSLLKRNPTPRIVTIHS